MRWDAFPFYNELELLELRLALLDPVIDRFVLCESTRTHGNGDLKPLYYADNLSRFSEWNHKITHVVCDDFPTFQGPPRSIEAARVRERWQRARLKESLAEASSSDLIYLSDIDEIPNPDKLVLLNPGECLHMSWDVYAVGLRSMEKWWGCVALTSDFSLNAHNLARYHDAGDRGPQLGPRIPFIQNGGWHLSWLGGQERAHRKQLDYMHTEMMRIDLRLCHAESTDIYGSHLRQVPVTIDLYPEYLVKKIESGEWSHLSWV